MKWHYQVVKRPCSRGEECFQIYGKFRQDERYGPYELTDEPVSPHGLNLDDLRRSLILMLADLEHHGVISSTNITDMVQNG